MSGKGARMRWWGAVAAGVWACAGTVGTVQAAAGSDVFRVRSVVRANGAWEMAQATAPNEWMPAQVPGTVLGTLVANKKVPDPYWGLNNKLEENRIPDLSRNRDFYTATFRSQVRLPDDFKGKTIWMRPEGINYRSEIFLNARLVASTAGMFARTAVDVTSFVKPGAVNDILVKVSPVDHPGTVKPKKWGAANNEWHNGGDGEIGRNVTMLMSAGWDFTFCDGVRDRNTGIWRDITFFATDSVRLDAPFVRTKLNKDFSEAELTCEVDLHNAATGGRKGVLTWTIDGTNIRGERALSLFRGERRTEKLTVKLPQPKLWWPRNKGPQNLYTAKVEFLQDKGKGKKGVSDRMQVRFGVREATSSPTGANGARQFFVNGRKIFIRGTNWIPEAMLKADDARMAKEIRLTAESGVNLLRLWAGGIAESDYFYQLCDEYGLLVWQEFWMTGDTRHPDDAHLYLANVEDTVKRIRPHASLVHWVASNESTEMAGTEELVKRLTGTTSWMMQSECDGVHDGSPYFPVNPMRYYEDTASPRGSRVWGFNPEYGTCALPCAEQLRTFMPEKFLWPMNVPAWKYREGGGFDKMTEFHHAHVNGYGESQTLDEYARKAQAADAIAHRALWETWNRARNRATGVLFWFNNTPIPQIGSHAWDYDLDQSSSFFAQKNALEPLHAQYEYLSNRVSVASDVYGTRTLAVRAEVYSFDSKKVWEKTAEAAVPGETHVDLFTIPFETLGLTGPHFIKLRLLEKGKEIASTFYWRSNARYTNRERATGPCVNGFENLAKLPKTRLAVEPTARGLRVTNVGARIAFMVRIKGVDEAKRYVTPVHYSENFFSLLPGEAMESEIEAPANRGRLTYTVEAWNTPSYEIK